MDATNGKRATFAPVACGAHSGTVVAVVASLGLLGLCGGCAEETAESNRVTDAGAMTVDADAEAGRGDAADAMSSIDNDAGEAFRVVSERSGVPVDDLTTSFAANATPVLLFDGESTFGWETVAGEWKTGGRALRTTTAEAAIVSFVPFGDCRLSFDVRLPSSDATAAVTLRTDRDDAFASGSLLVPIVAEAAASERKTAQSISPITLDPGKWTSVRVTIDLPGIEVTVADESLGSPQPIAEAVARSGHVGLFGSQPGVEFRRVALTPLDLRDAITPAFDWTPTGEVDVSRPDDGGFRLRGGLGFLHSESSHDDFAFQTEVTVADAATNSGVFFRAMRPTKPTEANGYEMQVSAGIEDGDRTRPVDAGAGAIFRRADARLNLLDPGVRTPMTLVAAGDRIMTWTAGYPVAAFQDTREPDENPRRGRRVEQGHFLLQGHDPGTDVTFHTIRIAPLLSERNTAAADAATAE